MGFFLDVKINKNNIKICRKNEVKKIMRGSSQEINVYTADPSGALTSWNSKQLPDYVIFNQTSGTTGVIYPASYTESPAPPHLPNQTEIALIKTSSVGQQVKLITEQSDFIEKGKSGFKGSVNKDVIEACINEGNRYMANSNIFTQMFLGV